MGDPMLGRLSLWIRQFNTTRLATAILFVAVFAMAARTPADTDTWWHLQAGRVTLESGRILQSDVFSHTRQGQPWINHSWLSQIILYLLFSFNRKHSFSRCRDAAKDQKKLLHTSSHSE